MNKLIGLLLLTVITSCGKDAIKKKQENLVMQAITNGQWKVSLYDKGGTDIAGNFAAYAFQFKDNFTVDAINNGVVEKTGTWNANADTQTFSSYFVNVSEPLLLLNGDWLITSSSWTYVKARQTVNGELRILRLEKL